VQACRLKGCEGGLGFKEPATVGSYGSTDRKFGPAGFMGGLKIGLSRHV
jgi:hypothetical protein